MAWAGTGAPGVMKAGVLKSYSLGAPSMIAEAAIGSSDLSFIQISDSQVGFDKPANPDVVANL